MSVVQQNAHRVQLPAAESDHAKPRDDESVSEECRRENTGRWTQEEHNMFLQGLADHGKGWKKIASLIKTRTVVQIRTHAQKYFQKLAKAKQGEPLSVTMDVRSTSASPRKPKKKPFTPAKRSVPPTKMGGHMTHNMSGNYTMTSQPMHMQSSHGRVGVVPSNLSMGMPPHHSHHGTGMYVTPLEGGVSLEKVVAPVGGVGAVGQAEGSPTGVADMSFLRFPTSSSPSSGAGTPGGAASPVSSYMSGRPSGVQVATAAAMALSGGNNNNNNGRSMSINTQHQQQAGGQVCVTVPCAGGNGTSRGYPVSLGLPSSSLTTSSSSTGGGHKPLVGGALLDPMGDLLEPFMGDGDGDLDWLTTDSNSSDASFSANNLGLSGSRQVGASTHDGDSTSGLSINNTSGLLDHAFGAGGLLTDITCDDDEATNPSPPKRRRLASTSSTSSASSLSIAVGGGATDSVSQAPSVPRPTINTSLIPSTDFSFSSTVSEATAVAAISPVATCFSSSSAPSPSVWSAVAAGMPAQAGSVAEGEMRAKLEALGRGEVDDSVSLYALADGMEGGLSWDEEEPLNLDDVFCNCLDEHLYTTSLLCGGGLEGVF